MKVGGSASKRSYPSTPTPSSGSRTGKVSSGLYDPRYSIDFDTMSIGSTFSTMSAKRRSLTSSDINYDPRRKSLPRDMIHSPVIGSGTATPNSNNNNTSNNNSNSAASFIKVSVRVRPLLSNESFTQEPMVWGWNEKQIYLTPQNFPLNNNNNLHQHQHLQNNYAFDHIFHPESNNQEIFDKVVKDIVTSSLEGYHGSVFMYGQTSSGKTFTMNGTTTNRLSVESTTPIVPCITPPPPLPMMIADDISVLTAMTNEPPILPYPSSRTNQIGIIAQTIYYCFDYIHNAHQNNNNGGNMRDYILKISYIEVYNEQIKDLLGIESSSSSSTTTPAPSIKLQFDPKQGCSVLSGVKEIVVTTPQQVFYYLKQGESQRHIGSTEMNEKSSRAHTLFKIIIESKASLSTAINVNPIASRISTLNLVDLAGSENAKMTNSNSDRAKEARYINQSLLTLSTIIQRLSEESTGTHTTANGTATGNATGTNGTGSSVRQTVVQPKQQRNSISFPTSPMPLQSLPVSLPVPSNTISHTSSTSTITSTTSTISTVASIATATVTGGGGNGVASATNHYTTTTNHTNPNNNPNNSIPPRRNQHLPYRDSKLTRILETALDGNARIAIVCTISPTYRCLEESINTLKFGTRAKLIKMNAKVNELHNPADTRILLRAYKVEIELLKVRLEELEAEKALQQKTKEVPEVPVLPLIPHPHHPSPSKPSPRPPISPTKHFTPMGFHSVDIGIGSADIDFELVAEDDDSLPHHHHQQQQSPLLTTLSRIEESGLNAQKKRASSPLRRHNNEESSGHIEHKRDEYEEYLTLSNDEFDDEDENEDEDDEFVTQETIRLESEKTQMIQMIEAIEEMLLSNEITPTTPSNHNNTPQHASKRQFSRQSMNSNNHIETNQIMQTIANKYGIDLHSLLSTASSSHHKIHHTNDNSERALPLLPNAEEMRKDNVASNIHDKADSSNVLFTPEPHDTSHNHHNMQSTTLPRHASYHDNPMASHHHYRRLSGIPRLGTTITPGTHHNINNQYHTNYAAEDHHYETIYPYQHHEGPQTAPQLKVTKFLFDDNIDKTTTSLSPPKPTMMTPITASDVASNVLATMAFIQDEQQQQLSSAMEEKEEEDTQKGKEKTTLKPIKETLTRKKSYMPLLIDQDDLSTPVGSNNNTAPNTYDMSDRSSFYSVTPIMNLDSNADLDKLFSTFAQLENHAEQRGVKLTPSKSSARNSFRQTDTSSITTASASMKRMNTFHNQNTVNLLQTPPRFTTTTPTIITTDTDIDIDIAATTTTATNVTVTQEISQLEKDDHDSVLQGISHMLSAVKTYIASHATASALRNNRRSRRQLSSQFSPILKGDSKEISPRKHSQSQDVNNINTPRTHRRIRSGRKLHSFGTTNTTTQSALKGLKTTPNMTNEANESTPAMSTTAFMDPSELLIDFQSPAVSNNNTIANNDSESKKVIEPVVTSVVTPPKTVINTIPMVPKPLYDQMKLDLTLKEADNQFLMDELDGKDKMLTMLTEGLKEVSLIFICLNIF